MFSVPVFLSTFAVALLSLGLVLVFNYKRYNILTVVLSLIPVFAVFKLSGYYTNQIVYIMTGFLLAVQIILLLVYHKKFKVKKSKGLTLGPRRVYEEWEFIGIMEDIHKQLYFYNLQKIYFVLVYIPAAYAAITS